MALVFNNVQYNNLMYGILDDLGDGVFIVQSLVGDPSYQVTLNGTVNFPGDPISWSDTNGNSSTFFVTAYDDSGVIVFTNFLGTFWFAVSNAPLTLGQTLTFSESTLGDYQVPCFAAGTNILTRRGEVAVEALAVGDEVVALARGALARVTWIGRREVACAAMPNGADFWPLRVQADAFAPGQPHADLFLSPDHAVHVDGALIPVRYLENGTSITRVPMDSVTYFHVELDRHDLLLAEGLATESFLDTGNRDDFVGLARDPAQALQHERAARAVWAESACLPLHVAGPVVLAARQRLAERAQALGLALSEDWGMRLRVDGVDHRPVRDGDSFVFTLPAPAEGARLVSECFVPAAMFPDNIDRRHVGVPVARIAIDGTELSLDDVRLYRRGWHKPENGLRWTNGAADLPPLSALRVTLAAVSRQPLGASQAA